MLVRPLAVLAALAPIAAATAEEVGRAEVDGRPVVLFENGTWRFARSDAETRGDCAERVVFASSLVPLSYCLSDAEWRKTPPFGAFEQAFAHKQANVFMGTITERAVLSATVVRDAIIANMEDASGLTPVEVAGEGTRTINGTDWRTLKLRTTIDGSRFVYWYYYLTGEAAVVQVLFWAPASEESDGDAIVPNVADTLRFGRV